MSTDITIDPAHTTAVAQPGLLRSAMKLWRTRIGVALVVLLVGVAIVGPWVARCEPR